MLSVMHSPSPAASSSAYALKDLELCQTLQREELDVLEVCYTFNAFLVALLNIPTSPFTQNVSPVINPADTSSLRYPLNSSNLARLNSSKVALRQKARKFPSPFYLQCSFGLLYLQHILYMKPLPSLQSELFTNGHQKSL